MSITYEELTNITDINERIESIKIIESVGRYDMSDLIHCFADIVYCADPTSMAAKLALALKDNCNSFGIEHESTYCIGKGSVLTIIDDLEDHGYDICESVLTLLMLSSLKSLGFKRGREYDQRLILIAYIGLHACDDSSLFLDTRPIEDSSGRIIDITGHETISSCGLYWN